MLKKRFFLAFTMLFITFFALYFKPWETSLPDEILLEFIDVLERVINNKRIVQETGVNGNGINHQSEGAHLFHPITAVWMMSSFEK